MSQFFIAWKKYFMRIPTKDLTYQERLEQHQRRLRRDSSYTTPTSMWMLQQPEIREILELYSQRIEII